jgi:formylglycine-generating enzyme
MKPKIDWIEIPGGVYIMGGAPDEEKIEENEKQHQVTLDAYKISKYPITVEQFKLFIEETNYRTDADHEAEGFGSSIFDQGEEITRKGINWKYDERGQLIPETSYQRPVIHVSWTDASAFAKWMNCRLLTEAEWEYACRAGTTTPFYTGKSLSTDQANYNGDYPYGNSSKGINRNKIISVGSLPANPWGLYDMCGNVWEWCNDCFSSYPDSPQINPKGPVYGDFKILRGGSWYGIAMFCRSAFRFGRPTDHRDCTIGFRIASDL